MRSGQGSVGLSQPVITWGQPMIGWGKETVGLSKKTIGLGKPTISWGKETIGLSKPTVGWGKETFTLGKETTGSGSRRYIGHLAPRTLTRRANTPFVPPRALRVRQLQVIEQGAANDTFGDKRIPKAYMIA